MNPLSFLKSKYQNYFIRKSFSKYIPDDVITEILNNPNEITFSFRETELDFCILKLCELKLKNGIDNLQLFLNELSSLTVKYDILIENIFPPYISLFFSVPSNPIDCNNKRQKFVEEIIKKFSETISIIHGKGLCKDGNYKIGNNFDYKIILFEIDSIIERLNKITAGSFENYQR